MAKYKKISSLILVLVLLVSLTACGDNTRTEEKETLNIGMLADPDTLNPLMTLDGNAGDWFASLTYPTLLGQDENADIIPYAAKDAKVSEDGMTVTYYLRDDLKWADGEPFTAEDVVYTKYLAGDLGLSAICGASLALVTSVDAVDEHTVEFKLSQPSYSFVNSIGVRLKIVPKHIWEKIDDPTNYLNDTNQVAMGPYALGEYEKGEYYTYEAIDDWFEFPKEFYAKKIVFRIYPDVNALTLALQNGEIDITGVSLSSDLAKDLEDKGFATTETNSLGFVHIGFNLNNQYLSDINIRKAIAMAVDKDKVLQFATKGLGSVMDSIISPAYPSLVSDDSATKYPEYNTEKAKALMAKAGYKDTDGDGILNASDGSNISFNMIIISNDAAMTNGADVVKQCLAEVGIGVEIEPLERATFIQRRAGVEFDTYLAGWGTMEPMLGDFIINYLSSSPVYFNGVKCDSIETAVLAMQSAKNEKEFKNALYDFQVGMAQDYINVPLYVQKLVYAYNPNVIDNVQAYSSTMRGVTCSEALLGIKYVEE